MWYHIFTFRISKFRRKKTLKRFRYFRSLFVVVEVINKNHILSIRLDFEEGERERVEKIKKKTQRMKRLREDATVTEVYEYFRDCLDMKSLGETLRDADLSGSDLRLLERMPEETNRRLAKLTALQRRRVRKVMVSMNTAPISSIRSYLLHFASVCFVLFVACYVAYVRNTPNENQNHDSTLLVVAGLEGTGHHMWFSYVFPDLSERVSSAQFEHYDEFHHLSRRLKSRVTKYPLAFEPNHTDTALFTYGEDSLTMLTNMFTLIQTGNSVKGKLYVLDICSFPCGPSRSHGHDPDLIMLRDAARLADPPLNFRVLLQWRDPIEAVASTTTNRKCCYVGDTLAVPTQAHVIRTSLMHMNNQLRTMYDKDSEELAVLDYNKFVEDETLRRRYVRAMSNWLNLPEEVSQSLSESVKAKVRKPSVRWADHFTPKESDYLNEIFYRKAFLWKDVNEFVKTRDLISQYS